MAKYVLVADFLYKGRRRDAGEVFSDEAGDPISDLLSKGAPLVAHTDELEALAQKLRAVTPDSHSAATLLTSTAGGSRSVKPDSSGVVHIYVAPTGSDANDGTQIRPYKTIGAAARRAREWCLLGEDRDLVIEATNGTYNEQVDLNLPVAPLRRVVLRGDMSTMTVIASGTTTAGDAASVTDSGASFTVDAHRGLILFVWNPNSGPANFSNTTFQAATIRNNTATVLRPGRTFFPVPSSGWRYDVREPAVIIQKPITGYRPGKAALTITPSWGGILASRQNPALALAWLKIISQDDTETGLANVIAIEQTGGSVFYHGVVAQTNSVEVVTLSHGYAQLGGYLPLDADPVFGVGAQESRLQAGLLAKTTYGSGDGVCVRLQQHAVANWTGSVADRGSIFVTDGSDLIGVNGGAVYDSNLEFNFFSGSGHVGNGFDSNLGFLVQRSRSGTPALRSGRHCNVLIDAIELRNLVGDAFQIDNDGYLDITAAPVSTASDIAGVGFKAQDGGKVRLRTAITDGNFDATGARFSADGTTVDTTSSLPLQSTVSTSRIWRQG